MGLMKFFLGTHRHHLQAHTPGPRYQFLYNPEDFSPLLLFAFHGDNLTVWNKCLPFSVKDQILWLIYCTHPLSNECFVDLESHWIKNYVQWRLQVSCNLSGTRFIKRTTTPQKNPKNVLYMSKDKKDTPDVIRLPNENFNARDVLSSCMFLYDSA